MTARPAGDAPKRRVLMIAYHFPPLAGSSGIQRTLRFVQHLRAFGWEPLVLTTHPRAYEQTSPDLDSAIPPGTVVERAFALDTARHLSIGGRYWGRLARPDRWMSWLPDGVRVGLRMCRRYQPQALWSTFPIATAHRIGAEIQQRTGLPWIADFRDPMAQDGYPADPLTWQSYSDVEQAAIGGARYSVFTTPGAARLYGERYPDAAARIRLIENGYDEDSFVDAERRLGEPRALEPGCFTLLHSGIVYPSERDPTQLLQAVAQLARAGTWTPGRAKLRFRAAVHEALIRTLVAELDIGAFVDVLPSLPYAQALQEMLAADALLVLQAANCNDQVPAKVYEYLRARRPIVCLTDRAGDTAAVLAAHGVQTIAPLDDAGAIATLLQRLTAGDASGLLAAPDAVAAASRRGRTEALARLLDAATAS